MNSKILARKAAAKPIEFFETRAMNGSLSDQSSNLEKRVIEGYAVIWGEKNMHREVFVKGSFLESIRNHGADSKSNYHIKFCEEHDEVICLFEELLEDEIGLYFRTVPLRAGDTEDRILAKISDGTYNNFSIGFRYIWDMMRWNDETDTIFIYEARLLEISVVGIPSDMETYAIRSAVDIDDLYDATELALRGLDLDKQIVFRKIFAQYQQIIDTGGTDEEKRKAILEKNNQETTKGLNFDYICKNI